MSPSPRVATPGLGWQSPFAADMLNNSLTIAACLDVVVSQIFGGIIDGLID
jgi:hypothetical protein